MYININKVMPSTYIRKNRNIIKNKKSKKHSKKLSKSSKSRKNNLIPKIKLCNTCFDVKNKNDFIYLSENEENWKEFPYHLPILGRTKGSQKVNINFGKQKSNRLVYYFSSKPKLSIFHTMYPKSYENSDNFGLVKLDENGSATVHLDCPQPYFDKNYDKVGNQAYLSHIHMLISNSDMSKWEDKLYTQNILCKVNKTYVLKSIKKNTHLIINALSKEYFEANHIPSSYNLYYKNAENMSNDEICNKIKGMIMDNKNLYKKLRNKEVKLKNTPIIVYCYSSKCDAGNKLADILQKNGFTNIVDYSDGIMGWMNRE